MGDWRKPNQSWMPQDVQTPVKTAENKVPLAAAWLGALGALPFVGLAGAMPFFHDASRMLIAHALVAYGATILSFLGGIHWGLAIGSEGQSHNPHFLTKLVVSVIPSLAGWTALLVSESIALFVLTIAIAAMLWVDIWATKAGYAPPWYPKLRMPLTCVVLASLIISLIL